MSTPARSTHHSRTFDATLARLHRARPSAASWTRAWPNLISQGEVASRARKLRFFVSAVVLASCALVATTALLSARLAPVSVPVIGLVSLVGLAGLLVWNATESSRTVVMWMQKRARKVGATDLTSGEAQQIREWVRKVPELNALVLEWVKICGEPQGYHAVLLAAAGPVLVSSRRLHQETAAVVDGLEGEFSFIARASAVSAQDQLENALPSAPKADRPRL